NTVTKGLLTVEGVKDVSVDLDASKVTVDTDDEQVLEKVKHKLSSMGYPEVGEANTMLHKAKSFVSCASGRMSK
ncbi:MAG: heavy metal-associated domain-containing protein, partial [Flavobacteriaceae bacterium]